MKESIYFITRYIIIVEDLENTGEDHSGNLDLNGRLGWGQIREGMSVELRVRGRF